MWLYRSLIILDLLTVPPPAYSNTDQYVEPGPGDHSPAYAQVRLPLLPPGTHLALIANPSIATRHSSCQSPLLPPGTHLAKTLYCHPALTWPCQPLYCHPALTLPIPLLPPGTHLALPIPLLPPGTHLALPNPFIATRHSPCLANPSIATRHSPCQSPLLPPGTHLAFPSPSIATPSHLAKPLYCHPLALRFSCDLYPSLCSKSSKECL